MPNEQNDFITTGLRDFNKLTITIDGVSHQMWYMTSEPEFVGNMPLPQQVIGATDIQGWWKTNQTYEEPTTQKSQPHAEVENRYRRILKSLLHQ